MSRCTGIWPCRSRSGASAYAYAVSVVARALCSDANQSAHSSSTVTALRGTNWSVAACCPISDIASRACFSVPYRRRTCWRLPLSGFTPESSVSW